MILPLFSFFNKTAKMSNMDSVLWLSALNPSHTQTPCLVFFLIHDICII